jgi:hypothetical protein
MIEETDMIADLLGEIAIHRNKAMELLREKSAPHEYGDHQGGYYDACPICECGVEYCPPICWGFRARALLAEIEATLKEPE